jgi:hypothetical protein
MKEECTDRDQKAIIPSRKSLRDTNKKEIRITTEMEKEVQ